MRQATSQEERRCRTRAALLDAATDLFVDRGYVGTSVDAVARLAGYTTGAVYDHFGSKEALLAAVVERSIAADAAAQGSDLMPRDDLEGRLRAMGRAAAEAVAHSTLTPLVYDTYAAAARKPELGASIGRLVADRLVELGSSIELEGPLSGLDLVVLGQAIIDGLRLQAILNPELVRPELFEEGLLILARRAEEQTIRRGTRESTS